LKDGRVRICTHLSSWSAEYSSVNTASIAGGFSSIILKTPNIEKKNNGIPEDNLSRLIIISGRNEEAVKKILSFVRKFIQYLFM
jgi:fatty acid synthase